MSTEIESRLLAAVAAERGHFRYESGHHGDLWLDLDRLLIDAGNTRAMAAALAGRAVACRPDVVCGPLTGGAFVAQLVAAEIGAGFVFGSSREKGCATGSRPRSARWCATGACCWSTMRSTPARRCSRRGRIC